MSSQHLFFSSTPSLDKYMQFEVSEDMLKHVSSGKTLLLRGQKGDNAVVCTDSDTFVLRQTQNSNSCFLIQPTSSEEIVAVSQREIVGVVTCSYDLAATYPRLAKIDELYKDGQYSSVHDKVLYTMWEGNRDSYMTVQEDSYSELGEMQYNVAVNEDSKAFRRSMVVSSAADGLHVNGMVHRFAKGFSYKELCQRVQCSEQELMIAMMEKGIFFVDGKFCLIDPDLVSVVLDAMVDIIGAEQWTNVVSPYALFQEIMRDRMCSPSVAAAVMMLLCSSEQIKLVVEMMMEDQAPVNELYAPFFGSSSKFYGVSFLPDQVTLNSALFSRLKARQIITGNPQITFHQFASLWAKSLPPRLECALEQLRGYLIVQDPIFNAQKGFKPDSSPQETLNPANHHSSALVVIFDEKTLEMDITKRFREIFKFQTSWTQSEIAPYIQRFTTDMSIDQLLVTHTRAIKVGPGSVDMKTVVYAKK